MERFDIHKWKPTECRNVAAIEAALRKFNVIGKKIISLRAIGAAANLNDWKDDKNFVKIVEHKQCKKTTMLPLRGILNEPVIFTFEDGSTLEILSKGKGKLLMASNQIPHGIKDGINSSNFNSEMFFRTIKGCSLTGKVSEHTSEEHSYYFTTETVVYGFYLSKDSITQKFYAAVSCVPKYFHAEFVLSLNKNNSKPGNSCIKIPAMEYINASLNLQQVIIYEGRMLGGYFDIYPINRRGNKEYPPLGKLKYYKDLININCYFDIDYLFYFLIKYFDRNYDYGEMRMEESEGFEPYLEFNLYTYETMRKMIADMRLCAEMLENDFENPYLDELKSYLYQRINERKSYDEKQKEIKQNTQIATDFYRRIAARLEAMMKNAPDYEFICFMGP